MTALRQALPMSTLLAVMLAACGGGDGSARAGTGDAEGPAQAALCSPPELRAQVLAAVNAHRATGRQCGSRGSFGPAAALAWSLQLQAAAAGHSQDMQANNHFSHTSADGRSLADRVDAQGYRWQRLGENIAAGHRTVQDAVDTWMSSDGHCANIMQPEFTEVGVACVPGTAANTYGSYWTMNLGTPR